MNHTRAILLAAALVCAPSAAHADADEASLDIGALGGAAIAGDPAAPDGDTARTGCGGLELSGTYATSDHYAYEVQLAVARTSSGVFEDVEHGLTTGRIRRPTTLGRLSAGLSARLGVRYVPTVQLAIGAQVRYIGATNLESAGGGIDLGPGSETLFDLVGVAGVGFDYRRDKHWIAGVSVRAVHAVSFSDASYDALEAVVSLAYYWYPRL